MNAITRSFTGRKRIRKSFGQIPEVAPMPNLIDVQRASYEAFLQMTTPHDSRTNTGLQEVFKSVFPIDDFAGRGRLEFVYYELEEPKYDVEECIQRGMTYRRAAEGHPAPDRLGRGRGHRRPLDPRHQGAARLHGRHAPDDGQRHLHHQRHRARHRQPDAPLPRRVLRPRQGQDAFLGQIPVRRPGHPLSRLLARFRVRQQGSRLRPHRPQAQAAGHHAVLRAGKPVRRTTPPGPRGPGRGRGAGRDPRHGCRGNPRRILRQGGVHPHRQGLGAAVRPRRLPRPEAAGVAGRCRYRRGGGRGRDQADPARGPAHRRKNP